MQKKIRKLLFYKNLIKILNGKRKLKGNNTARELVDNMYQILKTKEPNYNSLFEKIKSEIDLNRELACEDVLYKKRRPPKGKKIFLKVITAAAAVGLLLLTLNFGNQILVLLKGYKSNANPDIVAKLSQVYDRNKATLIIDDSLTINLYQDTAIFNVAETKSDNQENITGVQSQSLTPREEQVKMNTLVIPRGGEFLVTLPDGSEVFLNSNTRLTFPSRFAGSKREVYLEGEARFKVTKSAIPFRVVSGNSITTVLGTVFNIKSAGIADKVTLCSGSVEVSSSSGTNSCILVPEQQVSVSNSDITIEKVDLTEVLSWTEGKYYFKNIPLEEIAAKLYDWYDIKFRFDEDNIKQVPFTGMINRNSCLKTIFELFEMSYNLDFTVTDSCIIISSTHNY